MKARLTWITAGLTIKAGLTCISLKYKAYKRSLGPDPNFEDRVANTNGALTLLTQTEIDDLSRGLPERLGQRRP